MPDIRLDRVTKLYAGGVPAVKDVSLTIRDGEFMVLLGPSGCGKSTTLRMIAGLESISEGDLYLGERRINEVDPKDRDLAFVFQNYALFPHMTVRGNLTFGMRLRGVGQSEQEKKLAEVSALLGLADLLERKPGQLSGGQRQRVALGRALLREPVAFLLDEPLSNLDAKLRAQMRIELVKLHRRIGRTIVHVTHDQVEAMTMAERICIMQDGRVVQVGAPMEVYLNPASTFVAGFLASPPMNLLPARLEGTAAVTAPGLRLPLSESQGAALGPSRDREVTLGIRPEDLSADGPIPGSVPIDVTTVAVEALGPEAILVGSVGEAELSARMPAGFTAPIGQTLRLWLDPARIRLFDATTGLALPMPPATRSLT
ncbi:MAG: sn-glycerol-3-phosphate ABC transporter ATP-binding protein UgpC [Geminicoccaceae bacterium]